MLTGVLGITIIFTSMTGNEMELLYVSLDIAMLVALTGIYLFLHHDEGIWSILGYTIALGGNFISFLDFLLPDILWRLGSAILGVGLMLLAISAFKTRKFSLWIPILWLIAPIIGVPGLFSEQLTSPIISTVATTLFALSFFGAGYKLWNNQLKDGSVNKNSGNHVHNTI